MMTVIKRWTPSVWVAFFAFLASLCLMIWGMLGHAQPAYSYDSTARWCAQFRGENGANLADTRSRIARAESVSLDDLTRLMAERTLCGGSSL